MLLPGEMGYGYRRRVPKVRVTNRHPSIRVEHWGLKTVTMRLTKQLCDYESGVKSFENVVAERAADVHHRRGEPLNGRITCLQIANIIGIN